MKADSVEWASGSRCGSAVLFGAMLWAGAVRAQTVDTPIAGNTLTAQSPGQTVGTEAKASQGLEEIVVTARRREERGQDVPISITTFSGTRLEQQGIKQAQDLQGTVPSLVVGQNGLGVRESSTFTLRGQGATFQGSPGVVTYLNEVPLPAPYTLTSQGGPGNFLDLANMQVLAGPQGTLFGRNTTGGAVLLVPNRPADRFEGYVQGSYGNHNDRETEGVFNLPAIPEVLKVRLAAASQDRDGYTRDVNWNVNRDDTHYVTIRLGVDWTPISALDNYTMAYFTNSHNHGPGLVNEAYNVPGLVGAMAFYGLCTPTYGAPAAFRAPTCASAAGHYAGSAANAQALGPRATSLSLDEYTYIRTWGVTNTTRYAITPNTTIRNIVSYASYKDGYAIDEDGTTAQQYDTGVNGLSEKNPRDYFKTVTEELQLQGTQLDDHLDYTAGAFYFLQQPQGTQGAAAIDFCTYYNVANGFPCAPTTISTLWVKSRSEAAYAQGTYSLGQLAPVLDKLKLTLGYRYTWDQIDGNTLSYAPGPASPGNYQCTWMSGVVRPDALSSCAFGGRLRSSAPTWTAGFDYKALDGLLLYAKASRGYKAGGFNAYAVYPNTRTFGPEYDTTYEIGLKSDSHLGEVPLRFNADIYRTNYSAIQRAAGDYNPAVNGNGAITLSSAAAIIQGVELQAALKLTRALEFGLNYGYTDSYYTRFPYTPNLTLAGTVDCGGQSWNAGQALNLKCVPMQYVARNTASAHLQYTLPLAASAGEVTAFVQYRYQSAQHTEALFPPPQQPFEKLAAYSLLDLTLDWRDIAGGPVDVSFFMNNVTDKLYRTMNSNLWPSLYVASTLYGEPRMYGLRVRYHWGR